MEKRSTSKSPRSSSGSDGGDGSDGNDRSCSRSRSPRGSPPFHIDGVGGVCDSSCGRATNKPGSPRSVVQSPNSTFSPASFCLVSPDCSPPRSCALAYEDETEKEAGVEEAKDEVEEPVFLGVLGPWDASALDDSCQVFALRPVRQVCNSLAELKGRPCAK
eukprot:TRINITY_DN9536_c0_g1_i2.p2 TRINITY_DN9536_c0_g1~~TRINITY_DN9536_c0_g1_i2.p2  ORF type:complete len:161 (+),score=24.12 TRINITY_DN9536_c0_g1_i2:110-592(+)